MEVLLGPTYGMDVSAPSVAYVRDRSGLPAQDKVLPPSSCLFLKGDSVAGDRLPLNKIEAGYGSDDSSDRSSSIGDPGDSEDDDENDDVSSSKADGQSSNKLSLDSLEDSLPIKRGLSSHFRGKSKSYANLADVCSLKDLEKPENPFNKRRRVLMANKWSRSRKSSFYSWQNPKSLPLLALNEEEKEEEKEEEEDDDGLEKGADNFSANNRKEDESRTKLGESRLSKMGFSQSCFSLADLHEEHHLQ